MYKQINTIKTNLWIKVLTMTVCINTTAVADTTENEREWMEGVNGHLF